MLLAAGLATRSQRKRLPFVLSGLTLVTSGMTGQPIRLYKGRRAGVRAWRGFQFKTAITLNASPEAVYRKWRDLENLPNLLGHLACVEDLGDGRSRWVAKGPLGPIEWEAEILTERENEMLAWQSLPGSTMATAGSIRLEKAPAGRGTILRVSIKYDPPGGKVGATVASLLGHGLEQSVHQDLRRFKQLMEAGEIASTKGQPTGRCGGTSNGR